MTVCRDCGKRFRIQPLLDLPQPTRCMECLIGLEAEVAALRARLAEATKVLRALLDYTEQIELLVYPPNEAGHYSAQVARVRAFLVSEEVSNV